MSKTISTTLEKICLQEKGSIISGPFGSNISSRFFVTEGIPVMGTTSNIYTHLDFNSKVASANAIIGVYPTGKK